jgi:hypothetical protein
MADQLVTRLWRRLNGYQTVGKVPRGESLVATFSRELIDRNSCTVINGDTLAESGAGVALTQPVNSPGGMLVMGGTPSGFVTSVAAIPGIATLSLATGTLIPIVSGGTFAIFQLAPGDGGTYLPNDYDAILNDRSWYQVTISSGSGSPLTDSSGNVLTDATNHALT